MPHPILLFTSSFGSAISARIWSDTNRQYRYGFNGKEKDFETANDDFPITIGVGARIYDGRLGSWLVNWFSVGEVGKKVTGSLYYEVYGTYWENKIRSESNLSLRSCSVKGLETTKVVDENGNSLSFDKDENMIPCKVEGVPKTMTQIDKETDSVDVKISTQAGQGTEMYKY